MNKKYIIKCYQFIPDTAVEGGLVLDSETSVKDLANLVKFLVMFSEMGYFCRVEEV